MKHKILFLVLLLLECTSQAQSPYRNTEKYWWYRYRLVNDFMKVGNKCGESIPAGQRWQIDSNNIESEWAGLQWGDATQQLGNYINMLAGEHAMLRSTHKDVKRTNMELYYALAAYERLDKNAEEYCEDIDANYPCKPTGSWKHNPKNGFFIRDDVPYYTNVASGYINFLDMNFKHFNRPGITSTIPVRKIRDCDFKGRVLIPGGPPPYTPVTLRRMPVEESHDQIVQLFGGMGMATRLLDGSATYNGEQLADKAARNMFNMINYIPDGDNIFQAMSWVIRNPTTGSSVAGVGQGQLGRGGELFTFYSNGAIPALRQTANGHGVSMNEINDLGNLSHMPGYAQMWQTMQWIGPGTIIHFQGEDIKFKDGVYADTYAAFANDWRVGVHIGPWIIGYNTTFDKIKTHAIKEQFCHPFTPLMYRIVSGPGTGHGTDLDTKDQPSYENLLNRSAFCGNFSYDKNTELNPGPQRRWSDWYWSSDNWSQDYERRGTNNNNGDFNNLDYMMMFNLYNLCESSYLTNYFNSYYMEKLATPFIGGYGMIGSNWLKLTLNYLEYLSLVNKHYMTSHVTYRGAKVVDLLPGFEARTGSTVIVYVKDYDCSKESYNFATVKKSLPTATEGDDPESEYEEPIEYAPDMVPFEVAQIAGDPDWVEPDPTIMPTPEDEEMYWDSLVTDIYNSGDSLLISQFEAMFPDSLGVQTLTGISKFQASAQTGLHCSIYPTPNSGKFTVTFNQTISGTLSVTNLIGQKVYTTELNQDNRKAINLDMELPAGNYFVNIQTPSEKIVKKITIIK